MELEETRPLINGPLLGALGNLVSEADVGLDDVDELLGQVVLRALVVILEDGGAHLRRRNRKHRAHEPVGATPETAEAHEIHIFVANATQKTIDVLRLQETANGSGLLRSGGCGGRGTSGFTDTLPLCNNAADVLIHIAVGLARTATILRVLTATGYVLARIEHRLPAVLPLEATNGLCSVLANKNLRALNTNTAEYLEQILECVNVIDGALKSVMAEVARAVMVVKSTGAAELSVFQNAHARIS